MKAQIKKENKKKQLEHFRVLLENRKWSLPMSQSRREKWVDSWNDSFKRLKEMESRDEEGLWAAWGAMEKEGDWNELHGRLSHESGQEFRKLKYEHEVQWALNLKKSLFKQWIRLSPRGLTPPEQWKDRWVEKMMEAKEWDLLNRARIDKKINLDWDSELKIAKQKIKNGASCEEELQSAVEKMKSNEEIERFLKKSYMLGDKVKDGETTLPLWEKVLIQMQLKNQWKIKSGKNWDMEMKIMEDKVNQSQGNASFWNGIRLDHHWNDVMVVLARLKSETEKDCLWKSIMASKNKKKQKMKDGPSSVETVKNKIRL